MLKMLLALPISREMLSVPVTAVRFGKIMSAFEPFLKVLHVALVVNVNVWLLMIANNQTKYFRLREKYSSGG